MIRIIYKFIYFLFSKNWIIFNTNINILDKLKDININLLNDLENKKTLEVTKLISNISLFSMIELFYASNEVDEMLTLISNYSKRLSIKKLISYSSRYITYLSNNNCNHPSILLYKDLYNGYLILNNIN